MSNEIPEGYEAAENSAAKDIAMQALEAELEKQDINTDPDEYLNGVELIALAEAVVEALLKAGVTIPEGLKSPYSISAKEA